MDSTVTFLIVAAAVAVPCIASFGESRPTSPASVCSNRSGDPNTSSPPRCIDFSGYEWVVKQSPRSNPGPNAWADSPDHVWVDGEGLHLTIARRQNTWFASELVLNESLGYGLYTFQTRGQLDALDPNVVAALFTYNFADPAYGHREIDIEYAARLGFSPDTRGHFTMQQFDAPGHTFDFAPVLSGNDLHSFEWRADRVTFRSGGREFTYRGPDVPMPGGEHVRLNLWLFRGTPPSDQNDVHLVVTSFRFTP